MAAASREAIDRHQLAADIERESRELETALDEIDRARLALVSGPGGAGEPPALTNAGRQYLSSKGRVDEDSIYFLAQVIDDLHARRALLEGGAMMFERFGEALARGQGVEHARQVVPEAFAAAVGPDLAIRLFAAATALLVRLGSGEPAGCVAEEVMAVALLEDARSMVAMRVDTGELGEAEGTVAIASLDDIFELFEDDDVLRMSEMREPADAAMLGGSEFDGHAGVADQRLQAWFEPFWGIAATGHLVERPDR